MKNILFTLVALVMTVTMVMAQKDFKVLAVNADFNGAEFDTTITQAFQNSGYDVTFMTPTKPIPYDTLAKYDMVFWYAGNDAVDSLLWTYKRDSTGTLKFDTAAFYPDIVKYINSGKVFWLDGIDVLYDAYGGAPDTMAAGTFVHDYMGINIYAAQSHKDDGGSGVSYYLRADGNDITTDVDTVNWVWSSLWYADALDINDKAHPLYVMGGNSDYPLLNSVTSYYYYNFVYTQFRLGKVSTQDIANKLVKDILDAAAKGTFVPRPLYNYKVLAVNADFNGAEFDPVVTQAFQNSRFDVTFITPTKPLSYDELSQYDMVFWYAGNDAVDSLLWTYKRNDSTGSLEFDSAAFTPDIVRYLDSGKVFWLDGIDVLYDAYGGAPDTMAVGSFTHDVMGINIYAAQSHKDDGGTGVSYYLRADGNDITADVDTVNWVWSTLWYADALVLDDSAKVLYTMGGGDNYPLLGYPTSYSYYNFVYTQFRLGKVKTQDMANKLVKDILMAAKDGIFAPKPPEHHSAGVNDPNVANFSIYPNPATQYVRITGGKLMGAKVIITDMTGRTMKQIKINGNATINLTGLTPGIYNISVYANNKVSTQKLIVR